MMATTKGETMPVLTEPFEEDSHPVMSHPDSVTHWTCPDNPGSTHHIGVRGNCVYCGENVTQLRAHQELLARTFPH